MIEQSVATSYKRRLPSGFLRFSSDEGRTLFQEALTAEKMAGIG